MSACLISGGLLPGTPAPLLAQARYANVAAVTLHVANSRPGASDTNAGTERLPLKTIERAATIAMAKNAEGVPAIVMIHPGTYRESATMHMRTPAPVTFQAAETGPVVWSGSDVWSEWHPWQPGIYRHTWPFRWGLAPMPADWPAIQDITRRREMVFVNGRLLTQVTARAAMTDVSVYVDEQAGWIYLRPSAGTDLATAIVEVAIRPTLLEVAGASVTLRGLTFQHAATFLDGGAVKIVAAPSVLIEDTEYRWNNWSGLDIQASTNIVVRRSVANHNGGRGMSNWRNKRLLFEDNETSFNNWRGAWGGFFDWAMGGVKSMRAHSGTWRRHKATGNQAFGLWFDTDNQDILVDDSILCDNTLLGLFLEASQGPIAVVRSRLCHNGKHGVFGNGAARVLLKHNVFDHNRVAQIALGGSEVREVDNWETKQIGGVRSERWTLDGNIVVSGPPLDQWSGRGLSVPNWPWFLTTLRSSNNTWWSAETPAVFLVSPTMVFDLAGWQRLTRQDDGSVFADPRLTCPDQSRLVPGPQGWWKPC